MKTFAAIANAFYKLGAPIARLRPVFSWLEKHLGKPLSLIGIELFVAVSLSVCFFFLIAPQAITPRPIDGNESNAYLFTHLSHHPYINPHKDIGEGFPVWNARLGALIVSGWFYDNGLAVLNAFFRPASGYNMLNLGHYEFSFSNALFAFYHAGWLFLLFLLLIFYRKDALFVMLGVSCGLIYNLIVPAGQWYYPWDFPAMFFFTWACLLYDKREIISMAIVILLGSLFKETVICCALLILLGEYWPLRKRLVVFTITVIACVLARKWLMMIYHVNTMEFALNCSTNWHEFFTRPWFGLVQNLKDFAEFTLNNALFINAGAIFLVMLIPWRNHREVVFKILILSFVAGQMVLAGSGVLFMPREWYELMPLTWMLMLEFLSRRFEFLQDSRGISLQLKRETIPINTVMAGSYWLMITALAVLCAVIFLIGD